MILETENLNVQIGKKILYEHLNLVVHTSEIIGILGPNGCGKTTLLHMLAGILPSFCGVIRLQNQSLLSLHKKTLARKLGILFQDSEYSFPETVLEYCSQGRYPHWDYFSFHHKEDALIIDRALTAMDLAHLKNKKVQTLSGGEKQRLKIATLLTQDPQIFLLDEPTNHLDLHYQIKILKHFQTLQLSLQKSFIMTLHDVNLAEQFCNQILMLFPDGKTLFGETQSVLTQDNLSALYQYPMKKLSPRGFLPAI